MTHPKPYVAVATFCENAIEDREGVLSLIRIIDTVRVPAHPGLSGAHLRTFLVVVLRAGDAIGSYRCRLMLRPPSGDPKQVHELTLEFTGEERGINLRAEFVLPVTRDGGLYWVDVVVEDERLTSVPLRLRLEESAESAQ